MGRCWGAPSPSQPSNEFHALQMVRRCDTKYMPMGAGDETDDDEAEEKAQPVADTGAPPKNAIQAATDALMIGVINAVVLIPDVLAYTAIMFPNPFFRPYISALSKLVFFSSAMHQLCFSLTSSFPFAIGQVQDTGLIFLSAMSTSVVSLLQAQGETRDSVILTTTLLSFTLSTLIVGLLLILVGKNKLAGYIAYMPLPVVAAYLGYVGYFCIAAGASQASGLTISSIPSWLTLFSGDALYKSIVWIASFAFIYGTLRFWHHPLALPTVLCAVPIMYYAVLGVCMHAYDWDWHTMRQWLRNNGWITLPPADGGHETPWDVYQLYALFPPSVDSVAWGVLARQLPITLALFFVVTFGSCLDITAIQANLPHEVSQVDFDAELVTVGVSNVVTGLLGAGFTGSYIFSITIFTQRSGCQSRLSGCVVVVVELLLFLIPHSLVEFLPKFFYGALMAVFGVQVAADWLLFSGSKFSRAEFGLAWINFLVRSLLDPLLWLGKVAVEWVVFSCSTFSRAEFGESDPLHIPPYDRFSFPTIWEKLGYLRYLEAIMIAVTQLPLSGIEVGIGIGTLICAVHFAMDFSSGTLKNLMRVSSRSNSLRSVGQRKVLELFHANSVAMTLTGYIFFGSAVLISDRVKQIARDIRERVDCRERFELPPATPTSRFTPAAPLLDTLSHRPLQADSLAAPIPHSATARTPAAPLLDTLSHRPLQADSLAAGPIPHSLIAPSSPASAFSAAQVEDIHAACQAAKRFMLLDFGSVTGLDATAAAAFKTLYSTLDQMRVTLVLTGLQPGSSMTTLLEGNDVIAANSDWEGARCCPSFETMEEGLAWCEHHFLQVAQEHGILPPPPDGLTLTDVMHLALPQTDAQGTSTLLSGTHADAAASMQHFLTLRGLALGEAVFDIGDPADAFYIILSGEVTCEIDDGAPERDTAVDYRSSTATPSRQMRYLQYTAGGVIGDQDFFVHHRKRQFRAVCSVPGDVLVLSQSKYYELLREQPQLVGILHRIIYSSEDSIEVMQRALSS